MDSGQKTNIMKEKIQNLIQEATGNDSEIENEGSLDTQNETENEMELSQAPNVNLPTTSNQPNVKGKWNSQNGRHGYKNVRKR